MTVQKKANIQKSAARRAQSCAKPAARTGAARRAAAPKKPSVSKKTASLAAAEIRRAEVLRYRLIIGCVLLSIGIIAALALFLPKAMRRPVNPGRLVGVNADVQSYEQAVRQRCREYKIEEFSTLMLAMMQQESSGQGTDIFQCSESPFNTEYDHAPGSIADAGYSIQVGVETFAYCLKSAHCKHIGDQEAVKVALQDYNFGNGYAAWALDNYGGYSPENALEFSEMMKAELGWDTYGDPEYVEHVLQYITFA